LPSLIAVDRFLQISGRRLWRKKFGQELISSQKALECVPQSGAKWRWPVHLEPKNPTMDKKLAIIVCPTGALITREQNPNQPYTPEEVAKSVIEAYDEGASVAHLHVRDKNGVPDYKPESLKRSLELIFDKCHDIVAGPSISANPSQGMWLYEVETIRPFVEGLLKFGRRYMETTVITPISYVSQRAAAAGEIYIRRATPENLVAEVRYLQGKGIRPEFMGHDMVAIEQVKNWLIDTHVLEEPYFVTMAPGMHHSAPTQPDPWGLLYLINMRYALPENAVVGTSIGGRNWLALATAAVVLGTDFIRVGMEDTMWLYPHRDDLLTSNAQAVRKIAQIARELGREIATPDEARKMLGVR